MDKTYYLNNALTLNATGEKYNGIALQTNIAEIKKHRHQFREFDFSQSIKDGFVVSELLIWNKQELSRFVNNG